MHIVLVHPDVDDPTDHRRYQPLGLLYVAASLVRKGVTVEVIDVHSNVKLRKDNSLLSAAILRKAPTIVGFSTYTKGFENIIKVVNSLKTRSPEILIVLGGPHATALHEDILRIESSVDVIVRGEGELAFCDLIESIRSGGKFDGISGISYRVNGNVISNQDSPAGANLDMLPFPARQLVAHPRAYTKFQIAGGIPKIMAQIMTSRGCFGECVFCAANIVSTINGVRRVRLRSVANIVSEAKCLIHDFSVEHIHFGDDTSLLSQTRLPAVLEAIHSYAPKVEFSFTTRADILARNIEILPLLKGMGVVAVEIGIESGSDAVLQRLRKGTTVEQNKKAVFALRDHAIALMPDFIMFEPESTLQDIKQNITFLNETKLAGFYPPLIYNAIILYPGTRLWHKFGCQKKWEFRDPDVGLVYESVKRFGTQHQQRINGLIRAASAKVQLGGKTQRHKLIQEHEMKLNLMVLRQLPYLFLEKIVGADRRTDISESVDKGLAIASEVIAATEALLAQKSIQP